MNDAMLKSYLDGWSNMCAGDARSIEAMIAAAHPDIRFSDVNSPNLHVGHDGIRRIFTIAAEKYAGATIDYRDLLFDGRNWSIRWTLAGTWADGTNYGWRGASAGSVAEDGTVIDHTDYWSMSASAA